MRNERRTKRPRGRAKEAWLRLGIERARIRLLMKQWRGWRGCVCVHGRRLRNVERRRRISGLMRK